MRKNYIGSLRQFESTKETFAIETMTLKQEMREQSELINEIAQLVCGNNFSSAVSNTEESEQHKDEHMTGGGREVSSL